MTTSPTHDPPLRVMALHALAYCPRLFYLEEVEEIRVADEAIFAGRELHMLLFDQEDPSQTESRNFDLTSERLGLTGRVDAFRRRNGSWTPYEHKRGRAARGHGGAAAAWPSDRIQVAAYALLLEEETGETIPEGRVRYHESNVTVRVAVDQALREEVAQSIQVARELRASLARPPVTENARLCLHCSLAPVCLPEEERLVRDGGWEPVRLFPPSPEGEVVHVVSHAARVGRSGESLAVLHEEAEPRLPIQEIHSLVIRGNAQITTQALHLCADRQIPIHWISTGGRYLGGLVSGPAVVQRRIRQYEALTSQRFALSLARRLAAARVEGQLRFILRATRGERRDRSSIVPQVQQIRAALRDIPNAVTAEELRGLEGAASRAYFGALPALIVKAVDERLRPDGQSRRPPRDRFNAALSFLYALLLRSVNEAVQAVGLEPAFGFYHTLRSGSSPLVLDPIELFRVPLCDLPLVASVNRRHWDSEADFTIAKDHVWLSDAGRRKAIVLYEQRLTDHWLHPVLQYSLSYARAIELEVRLLEKEWTGQGGLFARARLR